MDISISTSTRTVTVEDLGPVPVTFTQQGEGRPVLLLHGGGGPQTVAAFAGLLAGTGTANVITPVHPGFGGTPRPDSLATIRGLAALYVDLLAELDLSDVLVVGNSIGGWITAEIGLLNSGRVSGLVLLDAAGIDVPGHYVTNFSDLTVPEVMQLSWHDPAAFGIDPTTLPPALLAVMPGNRASLAVYGGNPALSDSTLLGRLPAITVPTLVLWGDSDQMYDAVFGRTYAEAIPAAQFQLLTDAGHLPQIETPQAVLSAVQEFAAKTSI